MRILKKTLKAIFWVVISFLLIFIVISILIRIPAIQKKVADYATSFISTKTHTRVDIKKISISFLKSVAIEGLYLEDIKKDTLLYVGGTDVNISFKDLFHHEIHIISFALEKANLNLNRTETDSLFNYNFLLTAFADTARQVKTEPEKKSKWTFRIDHVIIKTSRLHYNDDYGGMNISAALNNLNLKIDQADLVQSIYNIDELLIEGLNANVLINKFVKTKEKKSDSILPQITANKVQIKNTVLSYGDSIHKQSVITDIKLFKLNEASADLQNQIVTSDNLYLSKSVIHYSTSVPELSSDTSVAVTNTSMEKSDWKVSAKSIDLDDNSIAYHVDNKLKIKNTFDLNHMEYKHLTLAVKDFYYSSAKTEASINKFITIDQNNFSVTKFETSFSMDQHSLTAKNLKVKTTNSSIDADLNIQYPSLGSLKDSIQLLILNLDIKNVSIKNSDILYFNPGITNLEFFKNAMNITTVSGIINGPVNNLTGKNLVIKTGVNTVLSTDFIVAGLPNVKTAYFNFPNLKFNSGKKDISMIADSLIPENIDLPENINIQVVFKGKINSFESTMDLNSSYGSAHLFAIIDKNENFISKVNITGFDLGSLLKNKSMFGQVSLTAETDGHGLDRENIKANIKAEVSDIWLNKYTYHKLNIDGTITGQEFEGKINLDDENAAFDFSALLNLNPDQEQYKFHLNLHGADLQKLNFTKDDIRIGLIVESDIKGVSVNEINGKAGISNIIITHEGKNYVLDSLILELINVKGQSELNVSSSLIDLKYKGTVFPTELPIVLGKFVNNYFPFSGIDSTHLKKSSELQDFNFEIQLHNHPILSEVFFPKLKEFWPGKITGSFDSQKNILKLNATLEKIVYGTTEIKDVAVDVNSDVNALNFKIFSNSISSSQIKLDNFLVEGNLANNTIIASVSSIDENKNKKLLIRSQIIRDKANYKLTLDPKDFYLMNNRWDIAADNYIEFGNQGFLIHHLFINKTESQINVASVNDQFNDDLNIAVKNFKLDDISGIIEKDTGLVKGKVDGNVLLKRVNNTYGLITDATISNLFIREVPIGNLYIKAENPTTETFNIDVKLSGTENNLSAKGYFVTKGDQNPVNINVSIQSLSLKTVQAFSMGAITEASGNLSGNLLIEGNISAPDVTGKFTFNNALIKPAALNNPLLLVNETVQLKKDGIYFNSFKILDANQHSASIDGVVNMEHFKNFVFSLSVNAQDFLLFNTTAKDNNEFFGRMIIDSKVDIKGPLKLPVVNANLKLKKGSNFTFAVSEKELTTDKGEGVVEFNDLSILNPILYNKKAKQRSGLTGFDISSIVEIDKQATLRLLLDPSTTDSLVVKGDAALSFTIDQSGKMSLTGAYNLNDGSYLVSLESVIKRKFDIKSGSTIIWNGDPMDAEVSINATYSVRAAPIDLVADQMSGLSETDKNTYKQRYPFVVLLKLRGAILHPEISFEIQLLPEDIGILGGAVNAKLNMLNEDPSALNKQVFALLVLGRFVQENPFKTESDVASSVVRTTVGKFLSAQLNQWSSKVVPGVELNFDIQSYNDYQSGQAQGRTQLDIGVKKQLFNERLSVQVGGIVDVEGDKAKQNSASDITSDVTIEYKITKDGSFRLKGFRHNQYEGAIEGQLVETGAGVLYVLDFNKWKEFFHFSKRKSDSSKKTNNNDTINHK
ncbi:MAG: translocation/assembly module TamB domain-containing protein [Bacteroidia bacterium]|nr:translocation/assembly module TamB domain-containing protein [Bacteroidia bacterium]